MTSTGCDKITLLLVPGENFAEEHQFIRRGFRVIATVRDYGMAVDFAKMQKPGWILFPELDMFPEPDVFRRFITGLLAEANTCRIGMVDSGESKDYWQGLPVAVFPSIDEFCRFALQGTPPTGHHPDNPRQERTGQVIAVACCKGGVGKTFVACSLAIHFAQSHPGQVALIDLDTGSSEVAHQLHLPLQRNLPELTASLRANPLDGDALQSFFHLYQPVNLHVFTGPEHPELSRLFDGEMMNRLLAWCRTRYRWIFIDTSPDPAHTMLDVALAGSDHLVVPVTAELSSLRQARLVGDLIDRELRGRAAPKPQKHYLVNRLERESELTVREVEQYLGRPPVATIPEMKRVFNRAVAEGIPVILQNEARDLQTAMARIHESMTGFDGTAATKGREFWIGKLQKFWVKVTG